ncbi:MAG: hypothetical protein J7L79_00515 [Thaumarchaeota archaeon]|nr:hypothetical protein [Nitrososphaerota archaeon]
MSSRARKASNIALKLLIVSAIGILLYYLAEGFSAASSAPPIFTAITIPLLLALITLGILSLLS